MAAEDHKGGRSPSVNPTKVDHSLDDLARRLSGGTISRREAVRLLGSALVGSVLASVPAVAWAAPGGNSAAAHFCNQLPPGPQRGQCTSDAAHGEGLAVECDADPARICPQPTAPDQLRCCPEGQDCCGTSACCDGTTQVCDPVSGTCQPRTPTCPGRPQGCPSFIPKCCPNTAGTSASCCPETHTCCQGLPGTQGEGRTACCSPLVCCDTSFNGIPLCSTRGC
jgi:hypothetical protein